jgi:hypothetical protein
MDSTDKYLVLTTADNKLHVFDMARDMTKAVEKRNIPWKGNTKCVCVGEVDVNAKGKGAKQMKTLVGMGGIEGRAAVQGVVASLGGWGK